MKVCDRGHAQIIHDEALCPACELYEANYELGVEIAGLRVISDDLRKEANMLAEKVLA